MYMVLYKILILIILLLNIKDKIWINKFILILLKLFEIY